MGTISDSQSALRSFAERRDWGQFHTSKNLVMALAGEVGELNAFLQWVRPEDLDRWLADDGNAAAIEQEIADVLAYLLYLSDSVRVDPLAALTAKLALNEDRYPEATAHGSGTKYNRLERDR